MEGTSAGVLILEILCRGFQVLLGAEFSVFTGARLDER